MKKVFLFFVALMAVVFSAHAVTFTVQVPAGTQKCYVCGNFNNWNVDEAPALTQLSDNMFTLTLPEVSTVSDGYKYLCGRSWDYVEKDASGGEISNRTTPGNPDIVGSWYHLPDYSIEKVELTVNGIKRLVKVYLPEGYDESAEYYPVIYYNTVQQRFNDGGNDADAGDDFFASNSWHAQTSMENLRSSGGKAYVMVQVCSFLAENTPEENPEFVGTGAADTFLDAFIGELMPYVKTNYRVLTGSENTTLVGADYGGLFSLYAALQHPEMFGNCVVMSPMLWVNPGAFDGIRGQAAANQKYYLSAGSLEPKWMLDDVKNMYQSMKDTGINAFYTEFAGAIHTDDAWGNSFGTILDAINKNSAPAANSAPYKIMANNLENTVYTLYGGTDQGNLQRAGTLTYQPVYYSGTSSTPVSALVITEIVPASNKTIYYWNIAKGTDSSAGWLMDAPKKVSFSSKKTADSWVNIAVKEDGSVHTTNAHCNAFSVVASNGDKTAMTTTKDFTMQATVAFPTTAKSFTIHYGSVNSASDMGALTQEYAVSDNCTEALITYDYNLNTVEIKESGSGESEPETEFKDRIYTLYGGETQGNLAKIGSLVYTEDYCRKGSASPEAAFVFTADIPVSVKGAYYYNIAKGADSSAGWIGNDLSVTFKSSKTEVSWLNVALFESGSVSSTAANSKAFRIVTNTATQDMQTASSHTTKATVTFPGGDKIFKINYGSVNTGTDMGAMTPDMSVSDDCIEAEITYDFNLNKVSVNETKHGQSLDNISVAAFTATPSVCYAGTPVEIFLELSNDCDVTVKCTRDFTQTIAVNLEKVSVNTYKMTLANPTPGIYTYTADISLGNNSLDNAGEINVRVLPADVPKENRLTVNAYENVDWANTGRYKANFHTHTSQSFDTQYTTTQVVDKYKQAGYKILALTDHDANSYPWDKFSLYNPQASDRNPAEMGMLAIPGNELSKDRRNNWSESTGGEFNHHNDFFTGRKGQEFMSLRESYAYTNAIGGMQIINHPGQYWNLSTTYSPGAKNSPEWHAENFRLYKSLIGLEVYNQGNRRPNDRILWDQILTINMPEHPVWGYSCDDTHTEEQYFRNYQFMLMDGLNVDDLKDAMKHGRTVFSYEFTGSGNDLAPHINSIYVDHDNKTITVDSDDADKIEWISSTHRTNASSPSTTKSTVVGIGNTFPFKDFQGSYVRARLTNSKGETATQPFGFTDKSDVSLISTEAGVSEVSLNVNYDPYTGNLTMICTEPMQRVSIVNTAGMVVRAADCDGVTTFTLPCRHLATGVYVIVVATERAAYTSKFCK